MSEFGAGIVVNKKGNCFKEGYCLFALSQRIIAYEELFYRDVSLAAHSRLKLSTMIFILASVCFATGLLLQKNILAPERLAIRLNAFVIWVALPAMILRAVPSISFSEGALMPIVVPWLSFVMAWLVVSICAYLTDMDSDVRLAAIVLCGLGNTAFLGIPLIEALLGPAALGTAVLYDQLGSFLVLSIIAVSMISLHGQTQSTDSSMGKLGVINATETLRRIFCFPPFVCLLASITLPIGSVVDQLAIVLDFLSGLILPVALLVVGLHFRPVVKADDFKMILGIGVLKLFLLPCTLLFFLAQEPSDRITMHAVFLQAAMPPMITPGLLLIGAGIAPRQVATALGYLTLLGCLTVYLWSLVINFF